MCTVWPSHLSEQSNESVSDFTLSLNISPWKLFRWFRRPQLWATGDWQLHHNTTSCIMSCAEFFGETSNHPGDSVPQQSRYGALWLLAFLKTKITFEREEILDLRWDSEKYHRAADWRTVWGPKVPTLKGTLSLSYVQCFFYLVSSSIKVSIFHITWLNTFWTGFMYAHMI